MGLLNKLLPQKPKEAEPAPELIEAPKLEKSNLVELIDRDSLHALLPNLCAIRGKLYACHCHC